MVQIIHHHQILQVPELSKWIASLGSGLAGADPSLVGAEQVMIFLHQDVISSNLSSFENDEIEIKACKDVLPQWGEWKETMMEGGVSLTKVETSLKVLNHRKSLFAEYRKPWNQNRQARWRFLEMTK